MRVLDLKIAPRAARFFMDALADRETIKIPFLIERLGLPQNSVFRVLNIELFKDAAEIRLQVENPDEVEDANEIADRIWSGFLATLSLTRHGDE